MVVRIQTFIHEPYHVNSHLVWEEQTRQAVLIDTPNNPTAILQTLAAHELVLAHVFQTHGFLEFLQGQPALREEMEITAHMCPLDEFWLAHLDTQATILNADEVPFPFIDQQILPDDVIEVDGFEVRAIHTPGNTPGGMSYYIPQAQAVFVGDVLYKDFIGPADVPQSSYDLLKRSIENKLFTLPHETRVYPGRGPVTTIGDEKENNTMKAQSYGRITPALWEG